MKDKNYRDGYVAAQILLGLPGKIRALRTERNWTQGDLARLARMAQPRISEIETPGERKLNLDTLQRIASAFDVGLEVDFVSFGELIERSEGFDPDSFSVQSFEPELAAATAEKSDGESLDRRKTDARYRHGRKRKIYGTKRLGFGLKLKDRSSRPVRPKPPNREGYTDVSGRLGQQEALHG